MPKRKLPNLNNAQFFELIERYDLEISCESDDEDEDKEEVWYSVFPFKTGGYWGYGGTLKEAILDCLRSNNLSV